MSRKKTVSDEELYKMKEQRMTYKEISQYFTERGIKISEKGLIKRVKKIYTDRNKKIPRGSSKRKKKKRPTDKMLYDLKKQGLSYADIVEYLASEKGITICLRAVAIRTKKIFDAKGEKVPIAKRKISNEPRVKRKNRSRGRMQVFDQELYKLKQTCMSDSAISKYLERKGIKLSPSAIRVRIKEIYSERGEKIPRGRKGIIYTPPQQSKLIEAIWNLKNTRNASDKQINKIAELYGVNLKRKVIRRACDRFRILRE